MTQRRAGCGVEGTFIGTTNRCASGGNDDGITHDEIPLRLISDSDLGGIVPVNRAINKPFFQFGAAATER